MKAVIAAGSLMLVCANAQADGYLFREGRFPEGKVSVFSFTARQKALVELSRRCGKDNTKTPYIFRLSPKQSAALKKNAGLSPARFAIFESSSKAEEGVDLEANVIVRFDESHFEVPHALLLADEAAEEWEKNVIGWEPNPLLDLDPATVAGGGCP